MGEQALHLHGAAALYKLRQLVKVHVQVTGNAQRPLIPGRHSMGIALMGLGGREVGVLFVRIDDPQVTEGIGIGITAVPAADPRPDDRFHTAEVEKFLPLAGD